jgi:hypothetical protein
MTNAGLRHVVLLRFKDETSDDSKRAMRAALEALPAQIPELLAYRVGADAGLVEGNFDFAIVADLAGAQAFRVYAEHPAHKAAIEQRIRPILAERVAVQYRLD